jgi:replication initiation and membrane attachment protein DnaB
MHFNHFIDHDMYHIFLANTLEKNRIQEKKCSNLEDNMIVKEDIQDTSKKLHSTTKPMATTILGFDCEIQEKQTSPRINIVTGSKNISNKPKKHSTKEVERFKGGSGV